jgi:hypothetical protein
MHPRAVTNQSLLILIFSLLYLCGVYGNNGAVDDDYVLGEKKKKTSTTTTTLLNTNKKKEGIYCSNPEGRVILHTTRGGEDNLQQLVWFNKNKKWLMERSGGLMPQICPVKEGGGNLKGGLSYMHKNGRRLQSHEIIPYLKEKEDTSLVNMGRDIPKNIILIVYPVDHAEDHPIPTGDIPIGWRIKTAHHEEELAHGFLKQIGHLHGGLGVPQRVTYYLIQTRKQRWLRFSSLEEALDQAKEISIQTGR